MRTRKEIEDAVVLPDVRREILLDIRQILANIMLSQPAPLYKSDKFTDFVVECTKIAEEG